MSQVIELRSDTFTQPTTAMKQAMMEAELGDDMAGEDPTVNRLEQYCCELFQKPAAVYCCSGTQSNQAAIWAQTRPGDEILVEHHGHVVNHEAGAPAALSGVSVQKIHGSGGMLDLEHLENVVLSTDQHHPQTKVLCLENTTNIGGGRAWPLEQLHRVIEWARERGLRCHLDGARFFNACVARKYEPAEVASLFDSISICFSKGLGCPMGSMLVGDEETVHRARRARKLFGGALRQTGIVAAAAQYALEHHIEALAEDHQNAYRLAERLSLLPGIEIELSEVETNIFFLEVKPELGTAEQLVQRFAERGVKMYDLGPQRIRVVTHRDVNREMIEQAGEIMEQVIAEVVPATA